MLAPTQNDPNTRFLCWEFLTFTPDFALTIATTAVVSAVTVAMVAAAGLATAVAVMRMAAMAVVATVAAKMIIEATVAGTNNNQ
jgi:hypothetical protein